MHPLVINEVDKRELLRRQNALMNAIHNNNHQYDVSILQQDVDILLYQALRNGRLDICQEVFQQCQAKGIILDKKKYFYAALGSGNADTMRFIRQALSIHATDIRSYCYVDMLTQCIQSKGNETFLLLQNEIATELKTEFEKDKNAYLKLMVQCGNVKLLDQISSLYNFVLPHSTITHLLYQTDDPQMVVYLMQHRGDQLPYATSFLQHGFDGLDLTTLINLYKGHIVNELYLRCFKSIAKMMLAKRLLNSQASLFEAILNNLWSFTENFIENNHDIHQPDEHGIYPLQAAILCNHANRVAELIKAGANVHIQLPSGDNLLTLACKMHIDNIAVINLLINSGINVNHENAEGNTALTLITSLRSATDENKLLALLNANANKNIENHAGFLPADYLIKETYYHQDKALSLAAKLFFSSGIIRASIRKDMRADYEWLATAVTIDEELQKTFYALILPMTVLFRFHSVIPRLPACIMDMRYEAGYTYKTFSFNILEHAAFTNTPLLLHNIIQRKLELESTPDVMDALSQALVIAADGNAYKSVKVLLKYDVNVNYITHDHKTALYLAIRADNLRMVTLLFQHGATVTIGGIFPTLLIDAIELGRYRIVKFLLGHVTDFNSRCLAYAISNKQPRIVNLLLESDTDIDGVYGKDTTTELICKTPQLFSTLPLLLRSVIKRGSLADLFTLLKHKPDLVYQIEFNKLTVETTRKLIAFVEDYFSKEKVEINFHYLSKQLIQTCQPQLYRGLLRLFDVHHSSDDIVTILLSHSTLGYSFTAILNDLLARFQNEPYTSDRFIYISLDIVERLNVLFRTIESKGQMKFPPLSRTKQQRLQNIYAELAAVIMPRFPSENLPMYLQAYQQNRIQFGLFTHSIATSGQTDKPIMIHIGK